MLLQERDRHLLRELAILLVIDRELAKVVAGFKSTTRANARLLALVLAGLLNRFFLGTGGTGRKALYTLTPRGAEAAEVPLRRVRRTRNEVLAADLFVAHQLLVNEVYSTLKYRPIVIPDARFVRWMSFQEPLDKSVTLIPDGYVEVESPTRLLAAFLEVDLGTEGSKVWRAKTENYIKYAVSNNFPCRFKRERFRALVIANSERRMQSIRATVAETTDKVFWFTTIQDIRERGFWAEIWLRPKGDVRLPLL